ncbi:MAG: HEPN domain-containing protein [Armatimonadetes bacterium]|nr:HEPN domain-containing protein [Armatimonadota bacterium]MDW8028395.1 HEPN domain-containing protein [Armatimonadota bacterium]
MVKAKEFFQAAKLALSHGLLNACVQDCYYAMFWATVAMLDELRIKAAYKPESVFKNEAQRALRYAETFVNKALEVRK